MLKLSLLLKKQSVCLPLCLGYLLSCFRLHCASTAVCTAARWASSRSPAATIRQVKHATCRAL